MKIIKISDHNYNPNWDYDVIEIDEYIKKITQDIIKDIESNLLPFLDIPSVEVHFVKNINRLGKYINGTSSNPVVVLDLEQLENSVEKYNVALEITIETTIVHELGHALQDKSGINLNEKNAEELAYQWHYNRKIPNWTLKLVNTLNHVPEYD